MIKKFILPILIAITLFSCEQDRKSQLIGRWQKIFFHDTHTVEIWEFTTSDSAYFIKTAVGGGLDTLGVGKFLIKNNVLTITGEVGSNETNFRGDHTISKVDDEFMILLRENPGLLTQEFIKEQ